MREDGGSVATKHGPSSPIFVAWAWTNIACHGILHRLMLCLCGFRGPQYMLVCTSSGSGVHALMSSAESPFEILTRGNQDVAQHDTNEPCSIVEIQQPRLILSTIDFDKKAYF